MRVTMGKFLCCAGLLLISFSGTAARAIVDFELTGLDGVAHRLSDYRGRWVVVNFWATWCGPCIAEMGELDAFHLAWRDRQANGAVVLGINFEQIESAELREFLRKHPVSFPILRIGKQPLVPFEPLKGIPTTAIVTPAGELISTHLGPVTRDALEQFIEAESARGGSP